MDKVVIIGANDFQNPLILKAKEMGYETHVFAWQDGSIGEKTADYFYPISITEKEAILEKCKQINPKAVASIGSDLASITVQYLAEQMGLPCNSAHCVEVTTNKYMMRNALLDAGIPVPQFKTVDKIQDNLLEGMKLPVIVKPTDRSGSRGITKIEKKEQLKDAIDVAVKNSFEKKAIVEEFLEGAEYSCECISYQGVHYFLSITKKFTTGAPHFIETAHMEPADISKQLELKVKNIIFDALDALEVTNGASHSEFKIDCDGNIRIIEIGARMGGDCIGSDLVRLSTGYDFVKMVLQVALGEKPSFEKTEEPGVSFIKFIFNKDDLNLLNKVKNRYEYALCSASEIHYDENNDIVDSSSRYGHFIMKCKNKKELEEILYAKE